MNRENYGQFLILASIIIVFTVLLTIWSWGLLKYATMSEYSRFFKEQQVLAIALEAIAYASHSNDMNFNERARYFLESFYAKVNESSFEELLPNVTYFFSRDSTINKTDYIVYYECKIIFSADHVTTYRAMLHAFFISENILYLKIMHVINNEHITIVRLIDVNGGVVIGREKDGGYLVLPLNSTIIVKDVHGVVYRVNIS